MVRKYYFFEKKLQKYLVVSKKGRIFASQLREIVNQSRERQWCGSSAG